MAPAENHRVRCPSTNCGAIFAVAEQRLGRSMHCAVCGVRMTARPLAIEDALRRQQQEIDGSSGSGQERLPLAVIVDNVRSLWNVGSIFRTADACSVQEILLAGISGCPPRREISKTALGAEEAVAWRYLADPLDAVESAREQGYTTVALETSPTAVALDRFAWPEKICLVVGNEVAGVSPSVLEQCDRHVRVPMNGIKSSLNVAVAFGIVAYNASRALLAGLEPGPAANTSC